MHTKLHKDWQQALATYLITPQFQTLMEALRDAYAGTAQVYPPTKQIFNALNSTALNSVKIVIIGQDPYHGEGQAHGLAFSVPSGTPAPPSLKNIFKEIKSDTDTTITSTDLSNWAKQGVLMLNSVFTVEDGKPGSHAGLGWQAFTDHVIHTVSKSQDHVVFMLWGKYAQSKKELIDSKKHLILEAPHPSPLSAYRGFFGCGHFSKANKYLKRHGTTPVEW